MNKQFNQLSTNKINITNYNKTQNQQINHKFYCKTKTILSFQSNYQKFIQLHKMKQKYNSESLPTLHPFLDKFAGKVNIITKRGQISNDKSLKLPLINSSQIHRSSTILLTRQKSNLSSLSSEGHRAMFQKSRTINLRAEKYLNHAKTKIFTDLSNNLMRNKFKDQQKKEMKKRTLMESLSTNILNRYPISQRPQIKEKLDYEPLKKKQTQVDIEYRNFMAQLQKISRVRKEKIQAI